MQTHTAAPSADRPAETPGSSARELYVHKSCTFITAASSQNPIMPFCHECHVCVAAYSNDVKSCPCCHKCGAAAAGRIHEHYTCSAWGRSHLLPCCCAAGPAPSLSPDSAMPALCEALCLLSAWSADSCPALSLLPASSASAACEAQCPCQHTSRKLRYASLAAEA